MRNDDDEVVHVPGLVYWANHYPTIYPSGYHYVCLPHESMTGGWALKMAHDVPGGLGWWRSSCGKDVANFMDNCPECHESRPAGYTKQQVPT